MGNDGIVSFLSSEWIALQQFEENQRKRSLGGVYLRNYWQEVQRECFLWKEWEEEEGVMKSERDRDRRSRSMDCESRYYEKLLMKVEK